MGFTLRRCACENAEYERIPRAFWMRLFPSRRLYKCGKCNSRIFARRKEMDALNWQMTTWKFLAPKPVSKKISGF